MGHPSRRADVARAAIAAALAGFATLVSAQDWPRAKPITIVVAFAPGSASDIVARLASERLNAQLGQSIVVDNKPGAGGNVGTGFVRRAAPDGYTLLATSVAFTVNPSLYANPGYDAEKDFIPVALGPSAPNIITVNPAVPARTIAELVELAKKQPLSYASSGIGTTTHLSVERLKAAAKIDITHVPYQPAQAVGAAVAGHTQISSTSTPPAIPQVRAGKVRPLAVTSAQRSPALPDVPTMGEAGYPGFDDLTWIGFFAPAGTPAAVVARLNAELNRAFESPETKARLDQLGFDFKAGGAGDFAAFVRAEIPKWARAVKDSGAKAE